MFVSFASQKAAIEINIKLGRLIYDLIEIFPTLSVITNRILKQPKGSPSAEMLSCVLQGAHKIQTNHYQSLMAINLPKITLVLGLF